LDEREQVGFGLIEGAQSLGDLASGIAFHVCSFAGWA
jgi:hypothetical protein